MTLILRSSLFRIRGTVRTLSSIRRFTKDHEWVSVDHNIGTIGITEYAQKALGDVVFVELPSIGSAVKKGDQIGAVESVKSASDIYTPISGEIIESNEALINKPGLVNKSAEMEGWLCKVRVTDKNELDELLDQEAYQKYAK